MELPGTFLLANEASLIYQISSFLFWGRKGAWPQRLWDLGHICFIVQEQVPRKPKTARRSISRSNPRWGLTPGGLGDPGLLWRASAIMNFTCFTISPWTYLLILNSVFFSTWFGSKFPLAQRLQSSMYYSFAALLWPRRIKLIEDRFSLSCAWDSGGEWMLTCLFVISLAQPSFLTDQHPGDLTDETILRLSHIPIIDIKPCKKMRCCQEKRKKMTQGFNLVKQNKTTESVHFRRVYVFHLDCRYRTGAFYVFFWKSVLIIFRIERDMDTKVHR